MIGCLFPGGVTPRRHERLRRCHRTLALGAAVQHAARLLDTKCRVPYEILDLPIGLEATDRFIDTLRNYVALCRKVTHERGHIVNMISNMHQYSSTRGGNVG